jgi:hypothetical protein
MSEWLLGILGSLCVLFAVAKTLGDIWCLIELCRKWKGAFELWGIDWLDIVYRLKRAFGVALTAADFAGLSAEARVALTAGQLWEMVAARIRASGRVVPANGWEQVVGVLSEALNLKPVRIVPNARLYADLGMLHGLY